MTYAVVDVFSLAGRLSDPNLDPANLELLVRIHFNKKAYMPSLKDIRERYFLKYRKAGKSTDEDEVEIVHVPDV